MVKNIMADHFNLSKQEFLNNVPTFSTLEITSKEAVGKNYQDLRRLLKKQFNKLSLKVHPDKGGDPYKFDELNKSHTRLSKYIQPLELGNPCNTNYAQGTGYLTLSEFNYRKQLFEKYHMTKEEVVNKDYQTILNILNKNSEYEQDIRDYHTIIDKLKHQISDFTKVASDNKDILKELKNFLKELKNYEICLKKPSIRLFNYVQPLSRKRGLIYEDEQWLSLQLIRKKLEVYTKMYSSLAGCYVLYMLLNNIVAFCYSSLALVIVFNIISLIVITRFVIHKFKNLKEHGSLIGKMDYIFLGAYVYLLAAFSAYLLISSFIFHGLTSGIVILGSLFMLNTLIIAYKHVLLDGCKTYINKNAGLLGLQMNLFDIIYILLKDLEPELLKDLEPEQVKLLIDQLLELIKQEGRKGIGDLWLTNKLKDILNYDLLECSQLKQYDPRRLFMPVVMPFIKKYFAEFESELAERNFNEVNTNMSDVNVDQPILAIQFPESSTI